MGKDPLDPLQISTEGFEAYLYRWGEEVSPGSGDVITGPDAIKVDGMGGMPIYKGALKPDRDVVGAILFLEKDGTGLKATGKVIEGSLKNSYLSLEGRATYLPGAGKLIVTGLYISGISLLPKADNE